jgi:hypothetical protein
LSDGLDDAVGLVGLLQGETAGHRTGLDRRKARRVDHLQLGIMLPTAFGDLPSVDSTRQPDVGDQSVRDVPRAPRERLFPVGSVNYLLAFLAQSLDQQFADKWIVLDHEYSRRRLLNTLISDASLERFNLETVPRGRSPSLQNSSAQRCR